MQSISTWLHTYLLFTLCPQSDPDSTSLKSNLNSASLDNDPDAISLECGNDSISLKCDKDTVASESDQRVTSISLALVHVCNSGKLGAT